TQRQAPVHQTLTSARRPPPARLLRGRGPRRRLPHQALRGSRSWPSRRSAPPSSAAVTETPLYRPITAGEFLHERKMRFSPDSLEATGIPFDAISHGRTEPLTPPTPSPDWQSRLGSISQVMPLDFEGYAAILLPWVASPGQIRYD